MDGDATNSSNSSSNSSSSGSVRIQQVGPSTSSSTGGATKRKSDHPEGDEETRSEFSCPYCYEDYEVAVLCSHLEDEHCYESKVAVCPICSTKVWKDMAGHITLQHSQLFKLQRRRRFRRSSPAASNATLSLLCKELREVHLQALLGPPASGGPSSSTDPFLSTFISNPDCSEASSSSSSSAQKRLLEASAGLSPEERNDRLKEASLRAKFVQELVISTLYR